jgi:hypothetical protein
MKIELVEVQIPEPRDGESLVNWAKLDGGCVGKVVDSKICSWRLFIRNEWIT